MSTGTQPLAHGVRWPHRRVVWVVVGLLAAAGIAVGVQRAFFSSGGGQSRPELQAALDDLVQAGEAPGVTAYVVGPHGVWAGSAGVANVKSGEPILPDARMRIESNSKTWLTALIFQLAQQGKLRLDDTVQQWLPGLLRKHGYVITIRELMTDSSGLIDDNDVWRSTPAQGRTMLARIGDTKLRTQLLAAFARYKANRTAPLSSLLFVGIAAWQPLVATPGTTYHHSNIGWNVAGLIAEKAGGKPLPELYRERLFRPLGLKHTVFSPQGPIAGQHANGYARVGKRLEDTTAIHAGKFSDGAIVTNAQEEATFLRAAMRGTFFRKLYWLDLYGAPGGPTGCGDPAYSGEGAGNGYRSFVWYDGTGTRVAVLLVNQDAGPGAEAAALRLYCNA